MIILTPTRIYGESLFQVLSIKLYKSFIYSISIINSCVL